MSDYAIIRRRQDGLRPAADTVRPDPDPGTPSILGRVFDGGSMPTSLPGQFAVHVPASAACDEAEGAAVTLSTPTAAAVFTVIGTRVPLADDVLVGWMVASRWVAESGGVFQPGPVHVPGCPCTTQPATLTMAVVNPTANNSVFRSCTLQWQTVPVGLVPLGIGFVGEAYLSTATFVDIVTLDTYRYYLYCFASLYYVLTRVYETSVFGSPYIEPIMYRWLIIAPGNSCSPFLMSNGIIQLGGDPSTTVTISG